MTTPISGQDGKVTYGSTPTTIGIDKWNIKKKVNLIDANNTTDGRKRVKGLKDAEGSVEGPVDTDADLSAGLAEGDVVVLKLYINTTKFYQLTAIIEEMEFNTEVEGLYKYKFSYKLGSGTVIVPVGA